LAAFLAPEPIPLYLFSEHAALLDEPIGTTAADADALADTLGALIGYSLARRSPDGFQVHRLVQAVIRHQLPPDRQQATAQQVMELLAAACPGDPQDPANWAAYAELAPHVLATAPFGDPSSAGRRLVLNAIRYLQAKGDSSASRAVCEQLLDRWRSVLGPDHPDTLTATSNLTFALGRLGEAESSRILGEDTVERCRRVLGPDHPTTLVAAAALTLALVELPELESGRILGEDTVERGRRVLGPDHPTTLWAAATLTLALVRLGAAEPARALGEDTLQRGRRVLGPDHPITLWAAADLTIALVRLGAAEPARALGEDTLQRCRRVLGPDHPITLYLTQAASICNLRLGGDTAADGPSGRPL
jgi:hypothetical protein